MQSLHNSDYVEASGELSLRLNITLPRNIIPRASINCITTTLLPCRYRHTKLVAYTKWARISFEHPYINDPFRGLIVIVSQTLGPRAADYTRKAGV